MKKRIVMANSLKFSLLNFVIEDLGAFERHGNARADIPCADMLFEFGLVHQAGGLLARAAQDESAPGCVHRIGQALRVPAILWRRWPSCCAGAARGWAAALEFVWITSSILSRGAKKKRPMNAEDRDVGRNFLVLQDVHLPFAQIFIGDLGNRRGGGDFADIDERREDHSRFHRHGQIREYREQRT